MMDQTLKIKQDMRAAVEIEAKAVSNLEQNLPDSAIDLVEEIVKTSGAVIFSGIGKSGHVARTLAHEFSSAKIQAYFLHPLEALHGDLGMVAKGDLLIAISKSGNGAELSGVLDALKSQGNSTVLLCCRRGALITEVDLVVQLPFDREACCLNLAPTASTTMMLAFGKAVLSAVSRIKKREGKV